MSNNFLSLLSTYSNSTSFEKFNRKNSKRKQLSNQDRLKQQRDRDRRGKFSINY